MCYYINTKYDAALAKKIFGLSEEVPNIQQAQEISAFSHPEISLILDKEPTRLQIGTWGLVPEWETEEFLHKNLTLNARAETLQEKVSFQKYADKRCVIPIQSFYEWRWENSSGSRKTKFEIKLKGHELCALAGIYSEWKSPNDRIITTFSVLTTKANKEMEEIQNSKKRMPILLSAEEAFSYLGDSPVSHFEHPAHNPDIDAVGDPYIASLF